MGLKVLVVDDNADTRSLMVELLSMLGHDAASASTKAEALRCFHRQDRTVLISDIGLPDGTGWELLRELRERGGVRFSIAISGFSAPEDVVNSHEAGFDHHLVKPVDFGNLEKLLRHQSDKS